MKKYALVFISLIGLLLSLYGIISAIFFSNIIWYSFLTIGSLLFLAPISYQLRRNSLRHTLLEFGVKSPFLFLFLYLIFFAIGSVVDLFYGTKLGHLWYYPHYNKEQQALHNLIIGYPFAFLSVIPLYEISEYFFLSRIKRMPSRKTHPLHATFYAIILSFSLILILLPIVEAYWGSSTYVSHFCVIGMLGGIVLVDCLREIIQGNSILRKILSGDFRYLLSILNAAWLAAFIHEVPNTVPQAWVYQNIPFTQAQIFGVNVIVFFFGWVFLTFVPVTIFRFFEYQLSHHQEPRCLGLEQPAKLLGISYVVFWSLFATLIVFVRHVLLIVVGAEDRYFLLTYLMAIGMVWIVSEIIWSYRALLKLQIVIGSIATRTKRSEVLAWYKRWVVYIYRFSNMAITGLFISGLFSPMIFKHKALCWTNSHVICCFDSIFYLFVLFLGGMSQFPFYGMSVLALKLPKQPLENINLFLRSASDVRRLGRFFGLVGLGGLGLICIAEIWLYVAPIKPVWLDVQLIVMSISLGTLPWFFLTQYNVHKLMVKEKKIQLDKVCSKLNHSFTSALKEPTEEHYYEISILTSLKTQIEDLPEWPFNTRSVLQLITAAGAVAALIPLIEILKKLMLIQR